jgi:type 1 fimbria pilin
MRDSAQYKNSKRLIQLALISGMLIASPASGFETNYDRGRVDFAGRVTDISCSVALNGGNNAGSGSVWLAPVSLAEVHDRGAGAFMKPQPSRWNSRTASCVTTAARRIKTRSAWLTCAGLTDLWSMRSAMKMLVI